MLYGKIKTQQSMIKMQLSITNTLRDLIPLILIILVIEINNDQHHSKKIY